MTTDGVCLHLDSDLVRSILLGFWYRQFVPSDIELLLYDDGGNVITPLTAPYEELRAFNAIFQNNSIAGSGST